MIDLEGEHLFIAEQAWNIHQFLMNHPNLLNKWFICLEQNVDNNHWISTCLCNPWFHIIQYQKKSKTNEVSEIIERMDADDFIHVFLMFDPLLGFLKEENLPTQYKRYCNAYVWLFNLASLYQDCWYEDELTSMILR